MADYSPNFTLNRGNALQADPGGVMKPGPGAPIVSGGGGSAWGGDPSIALKGAGGSFDPMGQASSMMNVILGLNQNKLFQYKLRSDLALGDALKESIDPGSGDLDDRKFGMKMATNPLVALRGPEVLKQIGENRRLQLENVKNKIAIEWERKMKLSGILAGLTSKYDPVTKQRIPVTSEDIMKVVPGAAEALGIDLSNPKSEGWSNFTKAVTDIIGEDNPEKITKRVLQLEEATAQQAERLKMQYGEIQYQNTGSALVPTRVNPRYDTAAPLGAGATAGPLTMGPTPQQMNEIVSVEGAQGERTTGPRFQVMPMFDASGRRIAAPGQGPSSGGFAGPVTGPTPEAVAAQQRGVDSAFDVKKELDQTMLNWIPLETIMEAQREALEAVKAGGGTATGLRLARVAQTLKNIGVPWITDEHIDKLASGDIAAAQSFQAAAASEAVLMMKNAVQGTGRAMLPEVVIFLERYGDISNDPAALEKIYDFTTQIGKKLRNMQKDFGQFAAKTAAGEPIETEDGPKKLPYGSFSAWANWKAEKRGDVTFMTTEERSRAGKSRARGAEREGSVVTLKGSNDAELDAHLAKLKPGQKYKGPDNVVRIK